MTKTSSFLRVAAACGLLALSACADMDEQQQKMVSGGAIGAVVGTVGVAITGGCIPCGTVIGGVVGVGAGYLIDQLDKNTKSSSNNVPTSPPAYNGGGASAPSSYNPPPASPYNGGSPSSYNDTTAPPNAYSSNTAYGVAPVTTH